MTKLKKYRLLNTLTFNRISKFKRRYEHLLKEATTQLKTVSQSLTPIELDDSDKHVPKKLSEIEWNELSKKYKQDTNPVVDIVVPVYKGFDETLNCIYSVLCSTNQTEYNLVVINDCSPDYELTLALQKIASKFGFEYIENKENQGFLKNTNLGMQLHKDRDVIWLNSDTEVFNDWIDRLRNACYSKDNIASVTPMSNAASIFTYPILCQDYPYNYNICDSSLDQICKDINSDEKLVEVPTGNGFCMYVKREALLKVGYLDLRFNPGYAEENDLCQRFIKAHYINVACTSVFVRHYGSTSFQGKRSKLCEEHLRLLSELYPNYNLDVQKWIFNDPLLYIRLKIECVRYIKDNCISGSVVHVLHGLGGGTQKFVDDLMEQLSLKGIYSFLIQPQSDGVIKTDISNKYPLLKYFYLKKDINVIAFVLKQLKVMYIHVHSLVNFDLNIISILEDLHIKYGFKIVTTIHDYQCICENYNLINKFSELCEGLRLSQCCNCNCNCNTYYYYKAYERLFRISENITVPSYDVKNRLSRFFSDNIFKVVPHFENNSTNKLNLHVSKNKLTICALGGISINKGFYVLEKLGQYIYENGINAEIVVIGILCKKSRYIKFTGKYTQDQLPNLIAKVRPSVFFQTSIWPETYSYTLSEMLRYDIPIACFDIGAPAERMRSFKLHSSIIPLSDCNQPEILYSRLKSISEKHEEIPLKKSIFEIKNYYVNLQ